MVFPFCSICVFAEFFLAPKRPLHPCIYIGKEWEILVHQLLPIFDKDQGGSPNSHKYLIRVEGLPLTFDKSTR